MHPSYRAILDYYDSANTIATGSWSAGDSTMVPMYILRRLDPDSGLILPDFLRFPFYNLWNVFETVGGEWMTSSHFRAAVAQLESVKPPCPIQRIVEFGGGSLFRGHASILQHVLLSQLQDIFSAANPIGSPPVRCYAQDPDYTSQDEKVLNKTSIEILDDPRGFLEVGESSVVVGISVNIPLRDIIKDIARPAVIIWDAQYVFLASSPHA